MAGRLASVGVLLLMVTGCASVLQRGQAHVITGVTPADDPFTLASRTLVDMGYAIQNADREAGFIVAEKSEGKQGFGNEIQVINVTFSETEDGVDFTVRGKTDIVPLVGDRRADNPDDIVKKDAAHLRKVLVRGTR